MSQQLTATISCPNNSCVLYHDPKPLASDFPAVRRRRDPADLSLCNTLTFWQPWVSDADVMLFGLFPIRRQSPQCEGFVRSMLQCSARPVTHNIHFHFALQHVSKPVLPFLQASCSFCYFTDFGVSSAKV